MPTTRLTHLKTNSFIRQYTTVPRECSEIKRRKTKKHQPSSKSNTFNTYRVNVLSICRIKASIRIVPGIVIDSIAFPC